MDEVVRSELVEKLDRVFGLAGEIARTPGLSENVWTLRKVDRQAREIRETVLQLTKQVQAEDSIGQPSSARSVG